MTTRPFFSIVIPMFNRATLVGRTIDSCLSQSFTSHEVIVVDDGSTDGSPEAVRRYADPRVRLEVLERNSGQNTARNRGAREARGEWLVFLDSDDELAEGALETMHRLIGESGPDVHKLIMSCRTTSGRILPDPRLTGQVWDYRGFVQWAETVYGRQSEALPCVRRTSFLEVPYSPGHALEQIHELDFVKRFRVRGCGEVVRIYHDDAANNSRVVSARRLLQIAPAFGRDLDDTVTRHGDVLAELAPRTFRETLGSAALYCFVAGRRLKGLRYALRYLRRRPAALSGWAILAFGLLGRRALAWVHEAGHRRSGGEAVRAHASDTA